MSDAWRWTVRSSRLTYRDRWITLRSDDCVTPAGVEVAPFHVLEMPDWVNVVAVTAAGEVLLVREYRHGAGEVVTGLPGGLCEPGDDHALAAARRELEEETGHVAARFARVQTCWANAANQTNLATTFVALGARPAGRRALDPAEQVELVPTDVAEAIGRLRRGALRLSAAHAAALWAGAVWLLGTGRAELPREVHARLAEALGG